MEEFSHVPVMLRETCEGLAIKEDGTYLDCTLGGGGHAKYVLERLTTGKLIAIDQDKKILSETMKKLSPFGEKIVFVNDNFVNAEEIIRANSPEGIDGAMIDLGVSSFQLDDAERGFSYHFDSRLDMRMNTDAPLSAYEVVNTYPEKELERVIREYGEEKMSSSVARAIVKKRAEKEIATTLELADVIKSAFPERMRFDGKHPARRTFQAIRIEVNKELDVIAPALDGIIKMLKKGGRLSVISFHSLEDRIVKETFKKYTDGCTCPRSFPVCVCGFVPTIKPVTRKPIEATEEELATNPRSRSAKLRIIEKL